MVKLKTVMKKELNESDIKALIRAHQEAKVAQDNLAKLKESLLWDLDFGKYESKFGTVSKIESIQKRLDTALFESKHPRIKLDDYKTARVVEMIQIKPIEKKI